MVQSEVSVRDIHLLRMGQEFKFWFNWPYNMHCKMCAYLHMYGEIFAAWFRHCVFVRVRAHFLRPSLLLPSSKTSESTSVSEGHFPLFLQTSEYDYDCKDRQDIHRVNQYDVKKNMTNHILGLRWSVPFANCGLASFFGEECRKFLR